MVVLVEGNEILLARGLALVDGGDDGKWIVRLAGDGRLRMIWRITDGTWTVHNYGMDG